MAEDTDLIAKRAELDQTSAEYRDTAVALATFYRTLMEHHVPGVLAEALTRRQHAHFLGAESDAYDDSEEEE